jgi:hypothetical protein
MMTEKFASESGATLIGETSTTLKYEFALAWPANSKNSEIRIISFMTFGVPLQIINLLRKISK